MVRINLLGSCTHCKGKPNDRWSPIFLCIYLFIRSEDHELNPYLLLLAGRVLLQREIRFLQFLHLISGYETRTCWEYGLSKDSSVTCTCSNLHKKLRGFKTPSACPISLIWFKDWKPENLIRKLLSKGAVTAPYICLAHLSGVLSKGECWNGLDMTSVYVRVYLIYSSYDIINYCTIRITISSK